MIEVKCAHDEMVPLKKLIPNPRNPNKHPKKQIAMLAKIIEAQGWRAPITVSNRSGLIVRGHCRLEAARLLKCKEAPVDFQEYATEAEEWADLIADNKIAELAETDEDLLRELLKECDAKFLDLVGIDDIEKMMMQDAAEKPIMESDTYTLQFTFPKDDAVYVQERLHENREENEESLDDKWRERCLLRLLKKMG